MKAGYYARKHERMDRAITTESLSKVQVMEFGGEIYVSYGGVPLVNVKLLNGEVQDALEDVRYAYREWRWAEEIY